LFKMARLNQIRWGRELSLGLTLIAGVIAGEVASFAGRSLLPNL